MTTSQRKRFIAPGAWFALTYPDRWNEFEDSEGTFLFYDPNSWNGNFRISAYKDSSSREAKQTFGRETVQQELKENDAAVAINIGAFSCAYSKEMFQEQEVYYVNHHWIIDGGHLAIECSFTVPQGGDINEAKQVIESIEVREENKKYPAEIIPIRLSEISMVDEAYEWLVSTLKGQLKKDFQGTEEDLPKLQLLIDTKAFTPKQRDAWMAIGITICVILTNEVEGLEWMTLIDGNRETPVLHYTQNDVIIDPMKLTWSKVKAGKPINAVETYKEAIEEL